MIDEPKWLLRKSRHRLRNGTIVENDVPLHFCAHPGCSRWGAFLIGAAWIRDQRGTAYCREHLPVDEALRLFGHAASVTSTTEVADAQGDGPGDLFNGPDVDG